MLGRPTLTKIFIHIVIMFMLLRLKDVDRTQELARLLFDGVLLLPDAYHMSVALDELDK